VRAEDRAVTESVARSRALHFCPTPVGSRSLSHALPRSGEIPLSSRRTFSTSLARAYGIRKNVPCSFPLSAISSLCRFNPPLSFSLFLFPLLSLPPSLSFPLSLSLSLLASHLLLHYFIVLVLRTHRLFRFISRNNSILILVFVSLTRTAYARIHPLTHTLISSLRVRCTREHPTQSATPTPSVYVPLMREGNLAYC